MPPPAAARAPELIAHIKRHRENYPGPWRAGGLNNCHLDPCDPFAARRILAEFAERCQAEQAGLRLSESDWNNWTWPERDAEDCWDPDDFDEDDDEEDDDA